MTNMDRFYQQMTKDNTNGALAHFNPQQTSLLRAKPEDIQAAKTSYSPISNNNQTWQQRNNPQIGAAAMGILNGDEFDKWAAARRTESRSSGGNGGPD